MMTDDEFYDYVVNDLEGSGIELDQIEHIVVGGQPAIKAFSEETLAEGRFDSLVSVLSGTQLFTFDLIAPTREALEQASPDFDSLLDSISFSSDDPLTLAGDTVTLEDSGISITYPANWIGGDDITDQACATMPASVGCLLVLGHPAEDGSNVILYRYPLGQPMTTEQFLAWMEGNLAGLQLYFQEQVEIDGHPALRIGFHQSGSYHVQWHILDGAHDLVLEFFAPTQALSDRNLADVEAIVATLRFVPE
jgi:hypothetical protein